MARPFPANLPSDERVEPRRMPPLIPIRRRTIAPNERRRTSIPSHPTALSTGRALEPTAEFRQLVRWLRKSTESVDHPTVKRLLRSLQPIFVPSEPPPWFSEVDLGRGLVRE